MRSKAQKEINHKLRIFEHVSKNVKNFLFLISILIFQKIHFTG